MSKNVVVLGTQWGDEGKGKIVDLLTDQASAVVRFQGGHNAGHTLVIGGDVSEPGFNGFEDVAVIPTFAPSTWRGPASRSPCRLRTPAGPSSNW